MTQHSFIAQGKRVLEIEAQAIKEIDQYIDQHFNNACQLMFQCTGRIIVIGMGKSGHVVIKLLPHSLAQDTCIFCSPR